MFEGTGLFTQAKQGAVIAYFRINPLNSSFLLQGLLPLWLFLFGLCESRLFTASRFLNVYINTFNGLYNLITYFFLLYLGQVRLLFVLLSALIQHVVH